MPYSNKSTKAIIRKTRTRRKEDDEVGRYFSDAWSLAKRTATGLNEIRKLINIELKPLDTFAQASMSQSGTVNSLSSVAQGDDYNLRTGDSIRVVKFEIVGSVFRAVASTANDTVRILVVRDLQNAGAYPAASAILESVGTATAPYSAYNALNGVNFNNRFTIVYDELVCLDASHQVRNVSYSTTHPCHVKYRGTANTIGSAGQGAYLLVLVTNASVNTPTFDFYSRITYTDN
jgi:hypothetical protein